VIRDPEIVRLAFGRIRIRRIAKEILTVGRNSRGETMANDNNKDPFDTAENFVPDPAIEAFMEEEIARAPKDKGQLAQRLRENTAASPDDAGGDFDADWEDVNNSGAETAAGGNSTPDQSDVEANAHALGINFEDNEELEFIKKIERRDDDRYELDEGSKGGSDTI
jgi:hypothetical protein